MIVWKTCQQMYAHREIVVWDTFQEAWTNYRDIRSNGWGWWEVFMYPAFMTKKRFNSLKEFSP